MNLPPLPMFRVLSNTGTSKLSLLALAEIWGVGIRNDLSALKPNETLTIESYGTITRLAAFDPSKPSAIN